MKYLLRIILLCKTRKVNYNNNKPFPFFSNGNGFMSINKQTGYSSAEIQIFVTSVE
jgi:hypothetical protein